MTVPSIGARDILVAAGVGEFNSRDDWSIQIGRMVNKPDTVIAIFDTTGENPNPAILLDYVGLQIRVRGKKGDYLGAALKAGQVKDALLGLPSQTINGDRWISVTMLGNTAFLGYDAEDRPEFTTNWRLIIEFAPNALTHRCPLGPSVPPVYEPVSITGFADSTPHIDDFTISSAPTITGTATADRVLDIDIDGNIVGYATVQSDGTWSYTFSNLAPGHYTATAADPGAMLNSSFSFEVFSPETIFANHTGLWYDMEDSSTLFADAAGTTPAVVGGLVGRINPKAGTAIFSQAEDLEKPTLLANRINGKQAIRFAANGRLLANGVVETANTSRLHQFLVGTLHGWPEVSSPMLFWSIGNFANQARTSMLATPAGALTATSRRNDADSGSAVSSPNGRVVVNEPALLEVIADYSITDQVLVHNDKMIGANRSFQTEGVTASTPSLLCAIAGNGTGTQLVNMSYGEIILIAGDISIEDQESIRKYLSLKWGVPGFNRNYGAWTWFNDPRAIKVGDDVVFGTVTHGGDISIATPGKEPLLLYPYFEVDDHDNPGFLRRQSDGKIMAFYTRHNDQSWYMLSVSKNPDDVSEWEEPVNLNAQLQKPPYSYAVPVQLFSGRIYLFLRSGTSGSDWTLHFSYSDDDGATWTPVVPILSGGRPYFKIVKTGPNRIDFLVTQGHPDITPQNNCYHFYMLEVGTGRTWHKSDGTLIDKPLPFDQSVDLTTVFDGSTSEGRGWIWDLQQVNGKKVAMVNSFPTTTNHLYWRAVWDEIANVWQLSKICEAGGYLYAGQLYYSGGLVIDHDNLNVAYCSREINGVHQLFRYETQDEGQTWVGEQLTSGTDKCFRPYIVPGTRTLLYLKGRYTTYTDYDTTVESMDI